MRLRPPPAGQPVWMDLYRYRRFYAPAELIQSLTRTPVLGCLPYLQDLYDLDLLAGAAADLELEVLLPELAADYLISNVA